jgi:hypothetical protein
VHDFNGGIQPSGFFWTVEVPGRAFTFSRDGRHATLRAEAVPVVDAFTFLPIPPTNPVPAAVSFEVRWEATGPLMKLGSGNAVSPTDPAAFLGRFRTARATGSFSGSELGFAFESNPGASSDRGFAELGRERNGVFLG